MAQAYSREISDGGSAEDGSAEDNAVEEQAEFDSLLSNKTELSYKAESSTQYAKNLKVKRYVLTFHEKSTYKEKHEVRFYDETVVWMSDCKYCNMFELITINTYLDFNGIKDISAINLNTTFTSKLRISASNSKR
ncbi:unnamed protein product [Rhizopus stolonifer]